MASFTNASAAHGRGATRAAFTRADATRAALTHTDATRAAFTRADATRAPQYFRPARAAARERQPWHGFAFFVEAIILMVFLVATMAVFTSLLIGSHVRGADTRELTNAIVATSNVAEAFATHPQAGTTSTTAGDFTITCDAQAIPSEGGTLYRAHLTTTNAAGAEVYQLDTAKYVSEVR